MSGTSEKINVFMAGGCDWRLPSGSRGQPGVRSASVQATDRHRPSARPVMTNIRRSAFSVQRKASAAELLYRGERYDELACKVVVVGPPTVGKTSLINRFLLDRYVADYVPTVEEFHRKEISVDGRPVVLDIVDTSGSQDFPAMRDLAITTGDGFLLVFDLASESTFAEMRAIRDDIIRLKGDDVPVVVVGNKSDAKERVFDRVTTECLVNIDWNHDYVETSAMMNVNVEKAFRDVVGRSKIADRWKEDRRRASAPAKLFRTQKKSCVIS